MEKRTLLIVNSNYPSEDNLYGDVFVHSRLRHYLCEFNIQVLGCKPEAENSEEYTYEEIKVYNAKSKKEFIVKLNDLNPDIIGIHFVAGWMVEGFIKGCKKPIFIWVHGYEALGWYRRLFNIRMREIFSFFKYVLANTRQMYRMHELIKISNSVNNIKFIFVSQWMRRIMETDTLSKISNFTIIPNPIDTGQFLYRPKKEEDRFKVLLIRSFDSKKYANDIAIDALLFLKDNHFEYFEKLQVAIYGKGYLFDTLVKPLRSCSNVKLNNDFVENKNIPLVHRHYGVFLCPTRQDAQGVSMCEAMASGLVPLSSNNTAIPEFVTHGKNGFLSSTHIELAKSLIYLIEDPAAYLRLSEAASKHISHLAGHDKIINKELNLLING